jgi:hypothetical protein
MQPNPSGLWPATVAVVAHVQLWLKAKKWPACASGPWPWPSP